MSFLEYRLKTTPTGFGKVFYLNWALILVITAVAAIGWLMLYSISGGQLEVWAEPQMKRYAMGLVLMFAVAFTPIWFWRSMSGMAYALSMVLEEVMVEQYGIQYGIDWCCLRAPWIMEKDDFRYSLSFGASGEATNGFIGGLNHFRAFLVPLQTPLGAEYPNAQAIAVTQHGFAVPRIHHQVVAVLDYGVHFINQARRHVGDGALPGIHGKWRVAAHKVHQAVQVYKQVERYATDVAVFKPPGLNGVGFFLVAQSHVGVLRHFNHHLEYAANGTTFHAAFHLAHGGVARVVEY